MRHDKEHPPAVPVIASSFASSSDRLQRESNATGGVHAGRRAARANMGGEGARRGSARVWGPQSYSRTQAQGDGGGGGRRAHQGFERVALQVDPLRVEFQCHALPLAVRQRHGLRRGFPCGLWCAHNRRRRGRRRGLWCLNRRRCHGRGHCGRAVGHLWHVSSRRGRRLWRCLAETPRCRRGEGTEGGEEEGSEPAHRGRSVIDTVGNSGHATTTCARHFSTLADARCVRARPLVRVRCARM